MVKLACRIEAVYRPHQTNLLDDGFSAEKNEASERIFFFILKKILIPPKSGASEEATI